MDKPKYMIQSHVTSLELSKRLKKLGVPQEGELYWIKPYDINDYFTGEDPEVESISKIEWDEMEKAIICRAFLSSELSRIILYTEGSPVEKLCYVPQFNGDMMIAVHYTWLDEEYYFEDTEQSCLVKILIDLINEGAINVKEL